MLDTNQGGRAGVINTSRADRESSFDLQIIGMPTGKEEDWRFTPVQGLQDLLTPPFLGAEPAVTAKQGAEYLTVVGRDDARLGTVGAPGDRAAVAAWNGFSTAHLVTVPDGVQVNGPIWVQIDGQEEPAAGAETALLAAVQHWFIDIGSQAEAVVVLDHAGLTRLNQTVEVTVKDGGRLTLVSIQDWALPAYHLANHRISLGKDAKLKHIVVTLGGELVRLTPDLAFTGPGGDAEFLGVYYTDGGQHHEHRLFVDHSVPHCRSLVTYKGALQGQGARAVWVGDVLIGRHAQGTDTYEMNRNLLLTAGARADSIPNLEIETGDIVGAGHASATGRFDDEQLFYLCSRGISEKDARRLVVRGFFAQLVERIEIPEISARIMEQIEKELELHPEGNS